MTHELDNSGMFLTSSVNSGGFSGDPTNADRAEYAQQALNAVPGKYGAVDDLESNIVDLIVDLQHLAFANGMDPATLLSRAEDHFTTELNEEE